jgi:uncharacterized protein YwbE
MMSVSPYEAIRDGLEVVWRAVTDQPAGKMCAHVVKSFQAHIEM